MKADSTGESEPNASTGAAPERVTDPFAVDLFATSLGQSAVSSSVSTDAADTTARRGTAALVPDEEARGGHDGSEARVKSFWHASLPRVTRREAQLSSALGAWPESLATEAQEISARVLARLMPAAFEEVRIEAVGLREVGAVEWLEARRSDSSPRVYAVASVEPEGGRLTLEAEAGFASALTTLMLGGDTSAAASEGLRPISKIERAIIEFLCLTLIQELNRALGEPLFRLTQISTRTPETLAALLSPAARRRRGAESEEDEFGAPGDEREERLLTFALRARFGQLSGILHLTLDETALGALDPQANPLLASTRAWTPARLAQLERFASYASLNLLVGETEVDALSLAALERGDVVLVERPELIWQGGMSSGELRVRAGDGLSVLLMGEPARVERAEAGDELGLLVRSISIERGAERNLERLSMAEEAERLEAGAEGADVLEALLLTVRVELAARRITLEELARLRPGQLLELGCRATDPVELVADNRRIATGELVEVEGHLGVRITKLWG